MKTYLKYALCKTIGVINSSSSNLVATQRHAVTPSLESIQLWDLKRGTLDSTLNDSENNSAVTCLATQGEKIAAGYADGKIRVWDSESKQVLVTFNGK